MFRSLLFTLAALASTTPALADPDDFAPTRRVSYADLDLSTDAGRATLNRRIEVAVRQVCGEADARIPQNIKECRAVARARANDQVASAVTKYNNRNQLALNGH